MTFDPDKHPKDEKGQFTTGSGVSGQSRNSSGIRGGKGTSWDRLSTRTKMRMASQDRQDAAERAKRNSSGIASDYRYAKERLHRNMADREYWQAHKKGV